MTEQDIKFLTTEDENENLEEFEKRNSDKLMRNSYTIKERIEIADKSSDIVKNAEKRILGTFEASGIHQDDLEPATMKAYVNGASMKWHLSFERLIQEDRGNMFWQCFARSAAFDTSDKKHIYRAIRKINVKKAFGVDEPKSLAYKY